MNNDDFTINEMQRMHNRDVFVKHQLSGRVAALVMENMELMAIIEELQRDLTEVRGVLSDLNDAEGLVAQLASDHAVVHPVSHDEAGVPGR